jgi:hypothetical protein
MTKRMPGRPEGGPPDHGGLPIPIGRPSDPGPKLMVDPWGLSWSTCFGLAGEADGKDERDPDGGPGQDTA